MKVIKEGRKQSGWAQEMYCTGVGNGGGGFNSFLLVEQKDIYCTYFSFCGHVDKLHTFRCPSCEVETDLPSFAQLPTNVKFPDRPEWLKLQKQ